MRIDVVDSTNRIVLSSDSVALGHFLSGMNGQRSESDGLSAVFDAGAERAVRRTARIAAAGGSSPTSRPRRSRPPYRSARLALVGVVAVLLVVLLAVLARRAPVPRAAHLRAGHRARRGCRGGGRGRLLDRDRSLVVRRRDRPTRACRRRHAPRAPPAGAGARRLGERDDDDVVGDHGRLRGDGGHRGGDRQHGERPVGAGNQHGRDDRIARAVGFVAEGARDHARRRRARGFGAQHVAARRSPWRTAPAWTRAPSRSASSATTSSPARRPSNRSAPPRKRFAPSSAWCASSHVSRSSSRSTRRWKRHAPASTARASPSSPARCDDSPPCPRTRPSARRRS